jgi:hypothetical protein
MVLTTAPLSDVIISCSSLKCSSTRSKGDEVTDALIERSGVFEITE